VHAARLRQCGVVEEQQRVGDVPPASPRLLLRQMPPAQQIEHGEDEHRLGLGLARPSHLRQFAPASARMGGEGGEARGFDRLVSVGLANAVIEEIAGEQTAAYHPSRRCMGRRDTRIGAGVRGSSGSRRGGAESSFRS